MQQTDYAYAVARIRANETGLLTKSDLEQLISADSTGTAMRILTDKGWAEPDSSSPYDICEAEMNRAWALLKESVPDASLLEALVIGNDFANLKAAVKSEFYSVDASEYMTCPYLCEPDTIIKAVKEADFRILPDYLSECADSAYHAYTEKQSGQLTEIIIDKANNITRVEYSEKSESSLLKEIIQLQCAVSDIKTARRCVSTGKTMEFAMEAVSGAGRLDRETLVGAAYAGDSLETVLLENGFEKIAAYADGDFTELEMQLDNVITGMLYDSKYDVFGPGPAVAYYFAKTAEVKNVRIILSAKASGVPADVITERVREIYV